MNELEINRLLLTRGAQAVLEDPLVGMSAREEKRYSIVRAINEIAQTGKLSGLELEASNAMAKKAKRESLGGERGFLIPHDVMRSQAIRAALGVSPGSQGGYLVGTDVLMTDMIELLRNKTMVANMGARTLSGLVGNVAVPRHSGGATAYWLAADGVVGDSDQAFAQMGLVPHRLVGTTGYLKELMIQTSLDVEAFVRADLMRVLAVERDRAALFGKGGKEPLGLFNTTGIGAVTFGAAATWAKVVDLETQLALANADIGNSIGLLTSPSVRGKWKTVTKIAGGTTPSFLWDTLPNGSPNGSGIVNGYRAEVTNQIPGVGDYACRTVFAAWNEMMLADWAGVDVVVDPYTYAKQGLVEVTVTMWTDMGLRHPASFIVSTDSGAQ